MSYEDLLQLPKLNGVTIIGDKTLEQYGILPLSTSDISEIFLEVFGYLI
jgi:hypothetical protein